MVLSAFLLALGLGLALGQDGLHLVRPNARAAPIALAIVILVAFGDRMEDITHHAAARRARLHLLGLLLLRLRDLLEERLPALGRVGLRRLLHLLKVAAHATPLRQPPAVAGRRHVVHLPLVAFAH